MRRIDGVAAKSMHVRLCIIGRMVMLSSTECFVRLSAKTADSQT
jgi:hypothetical protein